MYKHFYLSPNLYYYQKNLQFKVLGATLDVQNPFIKDLDLGL